MTQVERHKSSRMVWNGYIYHKTKQEKNHSHWRCIEHSEQSTACKGRVKLRNRLVKVTCKHNHGPVSASLKNYIPPPAAERAQKHKTLMASVKGFMISSDKEILRLGKTNVRKRHRCVICHMTFAISRVWESHMMIEHLVQARWRCGECGMQFLHGRSYNLHMIRRHSLTPYMCDAEGCSAVFNTQTDLKMHKQSHRSMVVNDEGKLMKEKPVYKCPHCPAEFPHPSKMTYHMRTHTGERPFKCHMCSRTFRCASHRTSHIKSAHIKSRQHLCNWCGKKFCTASALKGHEKTHTGEKPYSCPVCSRPFSKKNAMIVHIRQHTGEKPYVCDQCGQSFTVRVSLRTHLKSKHDIIVDTSMYKRLRDPGDTSMPPIGRPRREDSEKHLLVKDRAGNSETGASQVSVPCSGNMFSTPEAALVTMNCVPNNLAYSIAKHELHSSSQNEMQLVHPSQHEPMAMMHPDLLSGLKTESFNQDVMHGANLSAYGPIFLPHS